MAAGGSAPEFFTSLIGTFTGSDVGTGTIIGSAVFNVLFVIGACALVSKQPLELTWFPLARDSIFYAVSLVFVTVFFLDGKVMWYEALCLFLVYVAYVTFMAFNMRIEAASRPAARWPAPPPGAAQEPPGEGGAGAWAEIRDDPEEPAGWLGAVAVLVMLQGSTEPRKTGPQLTRSDSDSRCMESQKRRTSSGTTLISASIPRMRRRMTWWPSAVVAASPSTAAAADPSRR
ncbi:unnamed protein product [Prorocentrum cordatum]|uniref:Sodium/calcium exchanger membrane region domain-containing protein n=1 Tax=Prorocentrum cordatum TaxID=2364126 RepID=A0ABN9Y7N3_9DINO|nr:unnamed protein product [Polarella glacialis]